MCSNVSLADIQSFTLTKCLSGFATLLRAREGILVNQLIVNVRATTLKKKSSQTLARQAVARANGESSTAIPGYESEEKRREESL